MSHLEREKKNESNTLKFSCKIHFYLYRSSISIAILSFISLIRSVFIVLTLTFMVDTNYSMIDNNTVNNTVIDNNYS